MYRYIKRFLDIVFSLLLLTILLPFLLLITLIIKIDSKGPIFFIQERTGYKGKSFKLIKFRSMQLDNDLSNEFEENKTTSFGNFIRKYSLDELPQLINILKGEMSFIGPRPWIPKYYEYFTEEQKRRLEVLPGLTGLAQACGRNSISVFEKIRLDIKYVDNFSFTIDIKVIYQTMKSLFDRTGYDISKHGIYEELDELRINKIKTNEAKLDSYLSNGKIDDLSLEHV